MHIGHKFFKFPENDDMLYLSKPDNVFRKVAEENKMNMIEGLNICKPFGGNKKGFSKHQ